MIRRAGCLLVLVAAPPAAGQDRIVFRYQPAAGPALVSLTEVRTITTLFGFPAVPDGSAFELEQRISATQRVVGAGAGATEVEMTIDSVRARRRALPDGSWSEVAAPAEVNQPVRATVDEQFRVVGVETAGTTDGLVLRMLGGSFVGIGFAFPARAVQVGETFASGGTVQLDVGLSAETGLPVRETVLGDLALRLDSVRTSGGDELAYLSFRGQLAAPDRSTLDEDGGVSGMFSGGFAGRLIWSAGWNAFVSGAARFQLQGQFVAESAEGESTAAAEWDVTITHRLRP